MRFKREQKVCQIGNLRLGGQPGENPPLLIASMFQKGDMIIESRSKHLFNRQLATERIREIEHLSQETGIPGMVALVANSVDEMKTYIDFFISVTDMPFAIDVWAQKTRLAIARHIAQMGIQQKVLYNSITPWDEDIKGQILELKELGIKHVVVQVFDPSDKSAEGRIKSLRNLLPLVEEGGFESIIIDTAVMNLPASVFSLKANYLIKRDFGLPVGGAPSNGSYMWRKKATEETRKWFPAVDAATHAIAALASDFLFYGPTSGTSRIFPTVAVASSMLAAAAYEEDISFRDNHPISLLFPDEALQFKKEKEA